MSVEDTRPAATPEELFARFREQGEVEALGGLFDRVSPELFRMALSLAPDPASAEDALQETFLVLLEAESRYDPSRPLVPWLVGVLRMKVHEARRRARRDVDPSRLPPPLFPEDPAALAAGGEEVERIRAAIDALPEPYRAVAVLRWRYGLEPSAIADARNEPPGTIRSLLHRATEKLRASLGVLPAFLAWGRPPRGLDAVREAVLANGAAVAAATAAAGGAAALTLVTGGLLMANKILVAGAAALLLVGAGWLALRDAAPPTAPPTPPHGVSVSRSDTQPPAPPPAPAAAAPAPAAPRTGFPPPVDLSKCDRDLDLFGTTVDDEGNPVPGARVEVVTWPWRRSSLASMEMHFREEAGPSTVSSTDGTFCFRLTRGESVDLRAAAEGYGPGELHGCQAGERAALVLRRGGATVAVTVLDEDRRPVSGAALRFVIRSANSVYGRVDVERTGVSDAAGRCDFAHLPAGRSWLTVEHSVFGGPIWFQPAIPAEGTVPVEAVLPRGRTVSGRVTDASTGKPIPGARVGSNWTMDRPVTADAEGRYAFPGWLGKGTNVLTAAAAGYVGTQLPVPSGGDLDFSLDPGFAATGRILSADGLPVPGARVAAGGGWKDEARSGVDRTGTVTDGEGRFRLADLSRRCRHDLVAEARGHGLLSTSFEAPADGVPEVDLGDLALAAARAIEGRALDPAGEPLVGRDVTIAKKRGPGDPPAREGRETAVTGTVEVRRTDDLGRFRFPGLRPGTWNLKLVLAGAPIVETAVELPEDRDVLDVVLAQKGRSLTILVTDAAGRPIPGIQVTSDGVFPHPTQGVEGTTSIDAVTDAGGRARFLAIPEAVRGHSAGINFQVQPFSGKSAPPWATARTGPLVPAGQEVRVVLEPLARIEGKVVGPEGEPVSGEYVQAEGSDGKVVAGGVSISNERGEFSLGVAAGSTVTLRVPGHRNVPVENMPGASTLGASPWRAELAGVRSPAEGVVLRAAKAATAVLELVVLDLDGKPVPEFAVSAWRTGDQRTGKTDASGRIRWEGMIRDRWTVSPAPVVPAGMAGEAVVPAKVEVIPGYQEVLLRFRKGVAVEGTVLLPDGSPAAGAYLHFNFTDGGGGPVRPPRADDRGRFRLWFGEGDSFRIGAAWSDGKGGTVATGETEDMKAGQGEVTIRLAPTSTK
jgi:RNA polymerase sigma-70 factor (ECF subfamily)